MVNINTFIGCKDDYEKAKIVMFGAPYDGTSSYRPGSRFAPADIRAESYGIETYSPYLDRDLSDIDVFDSGDLELCFGNPKKVLEDIYTCTKNLVADKKIPFMIGGEHLITLGAVKALSFTYPNLHVIHFDAHADLRDDYLGEKLSHATVMRRCYDILGGNRIFQFGIRSGDREEFTFAKYHINQQKFNFNGIEKLKSIIKSNPVYFTLDLDVLDSSILPGTGTPEAGGASFPELMTAIYEVFKLNVVGFDIVELSPRQDPSGASTSLACKLIREILLQF